MVGTRTALLSAAFVAAIALTAPPIAAVAAPMAGESTYRVEATPQSIDVTTGSAADGPSDSSTGELEQSPAPTDTQAPTESPVPAIEPTPEAPGEEVESPNPELAEPPFDSASPVTAPTADAQPYAAAAAPAFSPGNLISDFNFFNSWAMTETEIQAFLQDKVGACANPNCLAAFRTSTPNASWSFGTCAPYPGAPAESAARIIYKVQRACGLSAKVILVTLQKEQGLITKSAPTSLELRKAMGMGCPDTSVCDSQYHGFFNQVYAAARQLTWYTNPDSSMYRSGKYAVGQVRPIQYHPTAACGAPGVYISNVATAALYWYTPYQPNPASLAAGWGASSDPCASYGNRNFWNYYNAWFGNPTTAPSPAATRLGGADRFDTAVSISRSSYPHTAPIVYVTTGGNYPDALAAGAAAAAQGAPLLLTDLGYVPASTMAELRRLGPSSILLVGGTAAVSSAVQSSLSEVAPVTRIAGKDRYETAKLVAQRAFGAATAAYLATGMDFPDALSASAAAGAQGIPVLLTNGALPAVDPTTITTLRELGITSVKLVGGTAAISPGVEHGLTSAGISVKRLAGSDRYRTSVAINRDAFPGAGRLYVATGASFADALAGSAAAGASGSPLYVSFPDCVAPELREDAVRASSLVMLGGPAVITDRVAYLAVC